MLFADPQLDPQRLAEIAGELSETMLDFVPVAAVDVQVCRYQSRIRPVPTTRAHGRRSSARWCGMPRVLVTPTNR